MKIAHLSDLHVTEGPALEDQTEDLDRVIGQILAERPDLVLLTGDYYGRTVPHRPTPRERAVLEPRIVRLAECCPVEILTGNHDHGEALDLAGHLGGTYPVQVRSRAGAELVWTPSGPAWVYWLAYPTRAWALASGTRSPEEARAELEAQLAGLLKGWAADIQARRAADPSIPHLFSGHVSVGGATLSGGEVLSTREVSIGRDALALLDADYGALGHIHQRQELAPRAWYVGSPWPVDFGERGPRGWNLVETGAGPRDVSVGFRDSGARPWVTLRYRWAADREDGHPRWLERPSPEALLAAGGAVVRARLVVPDGHVASCPWDAELEELRTSAHRLKAERVIEPSVRVRAPAVAEAATLEAKLQAYWSTLESPPEPQDRAAALEALAELQDSEDPELEARTAQLLAAAKGRAPELEQVAP